MSTWTGNFYDRMRLQPSILILLFISLKNLEATETATSPQLCHLGDEEIINSFTGKMTPDAFKRLTGTLMLNKKPEAFKHFLREAYHTLRSHQYDQLIVSLWRNIVGQKQLKIRDFNGGLGVLCDACGANSVLRTEAYRIVLKARNIPILRFIFDASDWPFGPEVIYESKDMLYLDDSEESHEFFLQIIDVLEEHDYNRFKLLPDDLSRIWYRVKLFENPPQKIFTRFQMVDIDGIEEHRWYLNQEEIVGMLSDRCRPNYYANEIESSLEINLATFSGKHQLAKVILERYLGTPVGNYYGQQHNSWPKSKQESATIYQTILDSPEGPLLQELKTYIPQGFKFDLPKELLFEDRIKSGVKYGFPEWIAPLLLPDSTDEDIERIVAHPNAEPFLNRFLPKLKQNRKKDSRVPVLYGLIQLEKKLTAHEDFLENFPSLSSLERMKAGRLIGGFGFGHSISLKFYSAILAQCEESEALTWKQAFIESAFMNMNYDALTAFKELKIKLDEIQIQRALPLMVKNLNPKLFDVNHHRRFFAAFNEDYPKFRIVFEGQSAAEKELQNAFNLVYAFAEDEVTIKISPHQFKISKFEKDAEFASRIDNVNVENEEIFEIIKQAMDNCFVSDHQIVNLLEKFDNSAFNGLLFDTATYNLRHYVLEHLLEKATPTYALIMTAWNAVLIKKEPGNMARYILVIKILTKYSDPKVILEVFNNSIGMTNFRLFRYFIVNRLVSVEALYTPEQWINLLSSNSTFEGRKFIIKALLLLPLYGYSVEAFAPPEFKNNGQYWYTFIYSLLYEESHSSKALMATLESRCVPNWDRNLIGYQGKINEVSGNGIDFKSHFEVSNWHKSPNAPIFYEAGRASCSIIEIDVKDIIFNLDDCIRCGAIDAVRDHTIEKFEGLSLQQMRALIEHPNARSSSALELVHLAGESIKAIPEKETRETEYLNLLNSIIIAQFKSDYDTSVIDHASREEVLRLLHNFARFYFDRPNGPSMDLLGHLFKRAEDDGYLKEAFIETLRTSIHYLNDHILCFITNSENFAQFVEFFNELRDGKHINLAEEIRMGFKTASDRRVIDFGINSSLLVNLSYNLKISLPNMRSWFDKENDLDTFIRFLIQKQNVLE